MTLVLDRPGYLDTLTSRNQWLDLVYRSDLDSTTKLVASVVERSCQYQRKHKMQLSSISAYSISRIIGESQTEVQQRLDTLFDNGWLFDTGLARGAKKVFALTFSVLPLGDMRT